MLAHVSYILHVHDSYLMRVERTLLIMENALIEKWSVLLGHGDQAEDQESSLQNTQDSASWMFLQLGKSCAVFLVPLNPHSLFSNRQKPQSHQTIQLKSTGSLVNSWSSI